MKNGTVLQIRRGTIPDERFISWTSLEQGELAMVKISNEDRYTLLGGTNEGNVDLIPAFKPIPNQVEMGTYSFTLVSTPLSEETSFFISGNSTTNFHSILSLSCNHSEIICSNPTDYSFYFQWSIVGSTNGCNITPVINSTPNETYSTNHPMGSCIVGNNLQTFSLMACYNGDDGGWDEYPGSAITGIINVFINPYSG